MRGELLGLIQASRLGQYNRLTRYMIESLNLDLRNCSVEDLERIPGCGPKTARMFLMFSRPNQRFAALDTHVLKHLRANGIQAPMMTPPAGKTYRRLEAEFLKLADASGMSVADYDLSVWKFYSGNAD
jgi:thermostable 8-oxoguanine DNA glycosylase